MAVPAYTVTATGRRVVKVEYRDGEITYRALADKSSARIYGPGWISLLTYRAAFGR